MPQHQFSESQKYSLAPERIIQLNQVALTERFSFCQPRTFVTVDSQNEVHMHEIINFSTSSRTPVPEKFLRHLKVTFTLDSMKSEEMSKEKSHQRIDLAHIEIKTIEIVDAEYLIVTYRDRLFFDIFNIRGVQLMRKHLLKSYP